MQKFLQAHQPKSKVPRCFHVLFALSVSESVEKEKGV
jgi:hypothetical protein